MAPAASHPLHAGQENGVKLRQSIYTGLEHLMQATKNQLGGALGDTRKALTPCHQLQHIGVLNATEIRCGVWQGSTEDSLSICPLTDAPIMSEYTST